MRGHVPYSTSPLRGSLCAPYSVSPLCVSLCVLAPGKGVSGRSEAGYFGRSSSGTLAVGHGHSLRLQILSVSACEKCFFAYTLMWALVDLHFCIAPCPLSRLQILSVSAYTFGAVGWTPTLMSEVALGRRRCTHCPPWIVSGGRLCTLILPWSVCGSAACGAQQTRSPQKNQRN